MNEHIVVSYTQEGDNLVCRVAAPALGLVAVCGQCGTILQDTDPGLIVGCPSTEKFGPLEGVTP